MDRWDDSLVDPPLSEQNRRRNRGMRDATKHSKQECPVCKTGYSVDEKNGTNCRRCGYPWPELAPPAQQAPAEPVDGEGDSAQLDSGQKLA